MAEPKQVVSVINGKTGKVEYIDPSNDSVRRFGSVVTAGTPRYKFPNKVPAMYRDAQGNQQFLMVPGDQVNAIAARDKGNYTFFPGGDQVEALRKQEVDKAATAQAGKVSSLTNAVVSGGEWVADAASFFTNGLVPSAAQIQGTVASLQEGDVGAALMGTAPGLRKIQEVTGLKSDALERQEGREDEFRLLRAQQKDQKPISTALGEMAPMIGVGLATGGAASGLALRGATGAYRAGASLQAANVIQSGIIGAAENAAVGLTHRAAQAVQADQQLGIDAYSTDVLWDTVIGGGVGMLVPGSLKAIGAAAKLGARGAAAAGTVAGANMVPGGASFMIGAGSGAIITKGGRNILAKVNTRIGRLAKGQAKGALDDVKTLYGYGKNVVEGGYYGAKEGVKGAHRGLSKTGQYLMDKVKRTPQSAKVNRHAMDMAKGRQRAMLDVADSLSVNSRATAGEMRALIRKAGQVTDDPDTVVRLGRIAQKSDSLVEARGRLQQLGALGSQIEGELQKVSFAAPASVKFPNGQAKRYRETVNGILSEYGDEAQEILTPQLRKMLEDFGAASKGSKGKTHYNKWMRVRNEAFDDIAARHGAYEAEQFLQTADDVFFDTLSRDGHGDLVNQLAKYQMDVDQFRGGARSLARSMQQDPETLVRGIEHGGGLSEVANIRDLMSSAEERLRGTGTQLKKVTGTLSDGTTVGKRKPFEQMKGFTTWNKGPIKERRLQGLLSQIDETLMATPKQGALNTADNIAEGFEGLADLYAVEQNLRSGVGVPSMVDTTAITNALDMERMVLKSVERFLDDVDMTLVNFLDKKITAGSRKAGRLGIFAFREGYNPDEKKEIFQGLREMVNQAAPLPARMEAMQAGVGEMAMGNPTVAAGFSRTASTAVDYLNMHSPKSVDPGFTEFSDMEMDEWLERYGASVDPVSVLESAKDGSVTSWAIDTVRTLYPSAYNHMSLEVAELAAAAGDELAYETLLGIDAFLLGALGLHNPVGQYPGVSPSPQTGPQVQAKGVGGGALQGAEDPMNTGSQKLAAV